MRRGKFVGKSIDALRSRRRFPLATFVSLQTARLFGKNTLGAGPSFLAGRSLQGVAWAMLSRLSTATSAVAGGGRSGALVRGARLPRLRGPQEHRQPRWMRIRAGAGADSALLDSDWADLLEGGDGLGTWSLRGGQVPSTSPEPSLPTSPESRGSGRVLLYRDTNSWCPFCERVLLALAEKGLHFETVFIDLRDKPQWYLDMVPTALVPSIRIDGELYYESSLILKALESFFPETPLMPTDPEQRQEAEELMAFAEDLGQSGYRFVLGRVQEGGGQPTMPELQAEFEGRLGEVEEALGRYPGPFFMPSFSIVDITFVPNMQRLAAQLPAFRGFRLRGNPSFPRVTEWLEALDARESFRAVKSDDDTLVQVVAKVFPIAPPAECGRPSPTAAELEAGYKLAANRDAIIRDILRNAGLQDQGSEFTARAVGLAVFNLAAELRGSPRKPTAGGESRRLAAVAAASLAFLRNRVSSPRDMSAAAAVAFRSAADRLIGRLYYP